MAQPRRARFNPDTTVSWSDSSLFDGYILIGVVPPSYTGTDSAYVTFNETDPIVRLPQFAFIKITAGKFDANTSLIFTSDIEPPNTQYICWYYDNVKRQIAGPSTQFTVTSDPFTPPSLTLTVPSVGSTTPTPG